MWSFCPLPKSSLKWNCLREVQEAEVDSVVILGMFWISKAAADEIIACGDVQGDYLSKCMVWCAETFSLFSKYTFVWLDAALPVYLPFMYVSE